MLAVHTAYKYIGQFHLMIFSPNILSRAQTMRRWLTFRNVIILITNLTFLVALILR